MRDSKIDRDNGCCDELLRSEDLKHLNRRKRCALVKGCIEQETGGYSIPTVRVFISRCGMCKLQWKYSQPRRSTWQIWMLALLKWCGKVTIELSSLCVLPGLCFFLITKRSMSITIYKRTCSFNLLVRVPWSNIVTELRKLHTLQQKKAIRKGQPVNQKPVSAIAAHRRSPWDSATAHHRECAKSLKQQTIDYYQPTGWLYWIRICDLVTRCLLILFRHPQSA